MRPEAKRRREQEKHNEDAVVTGEDSVGANEWPEAGDWSGRERNLKG